MTRPQEPTMSFAGLFRFAGITGALVLAIGSVALLGWLLDVRTLQSFYPGWVTMKANTATGLALGGLALVLNAIGYSRTGRVLGGVVAMIGGATAAQYLFGVDLGIDQLLFSAANETPRSATPGRMAAVTAAAFVLIGSALAVAGTSRGRRLAQLLAFASGMTGLAAVLGFIYGAISTVGSGQGLQIAIHTAIALVLLSAGTVALEARHGWFPTLLSTHAGGKLARRLLPLAFLVPLGLGALQTAAEWAGIDRLLDGPAIVAVLTMVAFSVVIWRTAEALNEADAQWIATAQERLTMAARADAAREGEQAERAARESAERAVREKDEALTLLNLVLDSSPVGFAMFDTNLRLRRVNHAFTEMTGARVDDHFLSAMDAAIPEESAAIGVALRQVLRTGVPIVNSERRGGAGKTGRDHHWLSSKYPVRSREGDIIGVGMTLLETTERKELEAQLQQAQKMEAIGQLAGGVAHDFNNVLTAIKSFGELVANGLPHDSDLHPDVCEIISAADRGTALTRQLLAFSRKQRLEPAVIDLNAVAEGVTKLLARLIGTDIHCETSLSPSLGRVLADPGQIEQVIVNLAVNARDAMTDGGTLRIETSNVTLGPKDAERLGSLGAPAGDYVMLAVSDTGMGMDAETQARIFDPFFTTKEAGKGTGLGLSTVYGIMRQSAGYVSVSSKPGRGTTFRVYLPRVEGEVGALVAQPRKVAPEPTTKNVETVLLVDDDTAVRAVLARILARAGFLVLSADSPAEAERIAAEHDGTIHLLMTDLMMPGMNGDELAQRILAARPAVRVLYTSGYTDDAVMQRGLVRTGDPFLSKPFTIEGVVTKVREALNGAAATHTSA